MISSEAYSYTVSVLEDKRDLYKAGQTVSGNFPSGNYMLDTREIYLLFDTFVDGVNVGTAAAARAVLAR